MHSIASCRLSKPDNFARNLGGSTLRRHCVFPSYVISAGCVQSAACAATGVGRKGLSTWQPSAVYKDSTAQEHFGVLQSSRESLDTNLLKTCLRFEAEEHTGHRSLPLPHSLNHGSSAVTPSTTLLATVSGSRGVLRLNAERAETRELDKSSPFAVDAVLIIESHEWHS